MDPAAHRNAAEPQPQLLIVDDNPVNRQILTRILKDSYRLQLAEDGQQCLQHLHAGNIDLVLLDLNMPHKSGFDVLAQIESSPPPDPPTFIVVSADNDPATISRALQQGASDYVATPFNREELLARVGTHLALRSREQELERRVQQRTAELEAANRELKNAQDQLILAEKMASLGQLSASIAHEINNPIGYIHSNLDSLKDYLDDLLQLLDLYQRTEIYLADTASRQALQQLQTDINLPFLKSDVRQLIEDALTGARQVKQIIADLKVFSHHSQPREWEQASLAEIIHSVLNIVHSEIKSTAQVNLSLEPDLPDIECLTTQLYQVLTNLVLNAAQAIEARTACSQVQGCIAIEACRSPDKPNSLDICIRDNGIGMEESTLKRIFEPFFTTKRAGKGTGLGLSVSYGIIEAHNGTIHADSQPGSGSCFTLQLPIQQTRSPATPASGPEP